MVQYTLFCFPVTIEWWQVIDVHNEPHRKIIVVDTYDSEEEAVKKASTPPPPDLMCKMALTVRKVWVTE